MAERARTCFAAGRLVARFLRSRLLANPVYRTALLALFFWMGCLLLAPQGFGSLRGVAALTEMAALVGIPAIAVAVLLRTGEYDLSLGAVSALVGMIIVVLVSEFSLSFWLAALAALLTALVSGLFHGLVVGRLGLPSLLVTLGSMLLIRGLATTTTRLLTGRSQITILAAGSADQLFTTIFAGSIPIGEARFSIAILWWIGALAVCYWWVRRGRSSRFGHGAADARGDGRLPTPIVQTRSALFMLTAGAAWLTALLQLARTLSADPLSGELLALTALAAAALGGSALAGGSGSILGAALGALILSMARQLLAFRGWDPDLYTAFLGGILLFALLLNRGARGRAVG